MNKIYISWNDIESLTQKVAKQLKCQTFDSIIGVAKGGLIPSVLLAKELNIDRIYSIGIKSYSEKDQLLSKSICYQEVDQTNLYGNICIIDDIADSGQSLELVKKTIINKNVDLCFVTLYYKSRSKFEPYFYGEKISNEAWIVFPWEKQKGE